VTRIIPSSMTHNSLSQSHCEFHLTDDLKDVIVGHAYRHLRQGFYG
jgi:hypothetical protein